MSEDLVLLELNARWNCDLPFGWAPITRPLKASEEAGIYQATSFHKRFGSTIRQLVAETFDISAMFEITEGGAVAFNRLDKCVFCYDGLEYMYTDAAFRFLIYFSHEESITIGGKLLLDRIRIAWPDYKNHLWDDYQLH